MELARLAFLVAVEGLFEEAVDSVGLAQLLQQRNQVQQLAVVHVVEPRLTWNLEEQNLQIRTNKN